MPFLDDSFTLERPREPDHRYDTPDSEMATVAYCHYGTVADEFAESLFNMYRYDSTHGKHWDAISKSKGPYIPMLRNQIVEGYLARRFSHWLLFLDNDMIFPQDTLERLMTLADAKEVPILAALYLTPLQPNPEDLSQMEYLPTWTHTERVERTQVLSVDFSEPLMRLDTCGMGCTLIHRSVFEAMEEAYPDDPWKWFNHDLVQVGTNPPERLGEDYSFCLRARELGFKVHGTPNVCCGHIKSQVLFPLSYQHARSASTRLLPTAT